MSSMISIMMSIAILVMRTVILCKMEVPLYGLTFVPIYGDYFYYSKLAPKRKGMIITRIILSYLLIIILIVALFSILASIGNGDSYLPSYISTVLAILGIIVSFIGIIFNLYLGIVIESDVAERFNYARYFGILFVFVQMIEPIMCLVAAMSDSINNNIDGIGESKEVDFGEYKTSNTDETTYYETTDNSEYMEYLQSEYDR